MLLAEDEPADIFMMQRAVRKLGSPVELQVVSNGEEVADYFLGERRFADRDLYPLPTLVLLDIKMPRKNGFEALEWLKANPSYRDIPVVMVTSSTVTSDVERAFSLGASAYLVKPVSIEILQKLFTATEKFLLEVRKTVHG